MSQPKRREQFYHKPTLYYSAFYLVSTRFPRPTFYMQETKVVGAMVLCARSLFFLLTGLGSWMIGSPAPTFFPWRTPWIALLLVAGGGLIPIWWKLGFTEERESTGEEPSVNVSSTA